MQDQLLINQVCKQRFTPAVMEIERLLHTAETPILVAIDGMCASGKTTLGYYLQSLFDCNLFHMDDFFLQNEQRTDSRLTEVGGNVDYERFLAEVITPILGKKEVFYRPFHCATRTIQEGNCVEYKRLNIREGSYSQHPYFGDVYQVHIFTQISDEEQMIRVRERNGEEMLPRFREEWIPKENAYFDRYGIAEKSILI